MTQDQQNVIDDVCRWYDSDRTRMMDILYDVQKALGGISPAVIDALASTLLMPRVDVESTVSFYSFFSQEQQGRFVIRLCNDIIDRFKGVDLVAKAFCQELGIDFGQTSADGLFTLQWTPCIGMCDQAPSALINEKVVTKLSSDSAREIIRTLRQTGDLTRLRLPLGNGNNSHPLVRSTVNLNLRQRGQVIFEPGGRGDEKASGPLDHYEQGTALQKALAMTPNEVIRNIKTSRLRGRGGAGFPTGMKWEFARNAVGERKYVLCNADEGEPGTFKDRVILTEVPELMFEGMTIAGYAIGAELGIVYLRGEYAYLLPFLQDVLERRRADGLLGANVDGKSEFNFDIRIQLGAGSYVCGEETALISSCEGMRGDPRNRPPFPAQRGYLDMPSIVNNVETFCCVARIVDRGPGWFNAIGTSGSSGTKLFSVSGDCDRPGVYELPFGVTLSQLLQLAGAEDAEAVQVGGAAGRMVGPAEFEKQLCYDHLATGGSIMVFGQGRDLLQVAEAFMEFFCEESCGYCTPCRVGNRLLRQMLQKVIQGRAEPGDIEQLETLARTIKATSRCGLGQTSSNPVLSTLESFRHEYERRVAAPSNGLRPAFNIEQAFRDGEEIAGRRYVEGASERSEME
jgi:[NiFe] hydrogenase diaphorase moiety large subunit